MPTSQWGVSMPNLDTVPTLTYEFFQIRVNGAVEYADLMCSLTFPPSANPDEDDTEYCEAWMTYYRYAGDDFTIQKRYPNRY